MRVLIVTTQVPFVRGGAEILAEGLLKAIRTEGHEAEIVAIPFKWYPPERILDTMLACRLLDLSEACGQVVDRIIGLKFPAYLIPHPNKVMWLLHQHRTAYDLWQTNYCDLIYFPNGLQIREAIINADNQIMKEYSSIYTIAGNVSKRLKKFNQVDSIPLYHPPQNSELFYCQEPDDYFFFPSRLTTLKRQELVITAIAQTKNPVKVLFAGKPDTIAYAEHLNNLAKKLRVTKKIVFLGEISEEEKIRRYAKSIGVIYPPLDEDYGYVTLEAMLASKPVITCTDSGGSLEFIRHEETGLYSEPTPQSLAAAMDQLWENRSWAQFLGKAGRDYYDSLNISWSKVVQKLLS
ncbi:glycosyltransferase family 4 protein [Nostoc sp. CENA67]|uniref:Glycosyltransferase family 4 protein n=1 Tax=Amazonocrinis nigriterrae CENA67 TaxID=2794033 RepID=A0A8J7HZ18_9NOST|nr:glycosyltransferase family 4 protein [Amazonocrinis nigriterrae]MBH8566850.1 glycosyltransferase family 4 protein [Amazonocrinis nigriterrae CENA67]